MSLWIKLESDFNCIYMCIFNGNVLLYRFIKALEDKPVLL